MAVKLRLVFTITIAFLSFYVSAQNDYWQQSGSNNQLSAAFTQRFSIDKGRQFSFNEKVFKQNLAKNSSAKNNMPIVYFPNKKGELIAFKVFETPIMSKDLSLKFPEIKSYSGYAIHNKGVKIRFSVSHNGVQSMMISSDGADPVFMQKDTGNTYVLYSRDPNSRLNSDFLCSTKAIASEPVARLSRKGFNDMSLRKFRLAVSATGEYTAFHGGSTADAIAAINASVTRINQVFETDLAITLELVDGLEDVVFTNANTDPFDSNFSSETQATLDDKIGSENYDIGILFHKSPVANGSSGFLPAVCINGRKGSAFATSPTPQGDLYDIDFVAHEMGHQFGANHTWSYESEGTRAQVEPGSGTTIMGYAGIARENNVAPNGDDYFHHVTIDQIRDYVVSTTCPEIVPLTNVPPVITSPGDFVIPKSTAFVLSAEATDANTDDILTYAWEQVDVGVVTNVTFGPTNRLGANFRSQKPTTETDRYFPKLSSVINGELTQTAPTITSSWETVSDIGREMNFALTVRDNAIGGGQVRSELVNVKVENNAGPFVVTSQATAFNTSAGSVITITWDVANTFVAPVNAKEVDILLSNDGGLTFPITLAENVPNRGSHDVVLPNEITSRARIMVKANDNIFFAVNSTDFNIEGSSIILNFEELEHTLCQGNNLNIPFTYEAFQGFNEEVTFSLVDAPDGGDFTISPQVVTTTNTPVEINITNTQNIASGIYSVKILATSASFSKEVPLAITVFNTTSNPIELVSPADDLMNVSSDTNLEWERDTNAKSYTVEIATDENFLNIVESAEVIDTSYRPANLTFETAYFWHVKRTNDCNESAFGSVFKFTTVGVTCSNFMGRGLPLTITDIGTPTVNSKLYVFDDLRIEDVNVNLEIDHEFLSDLTIELTSPEGTSVVLINNSCSSEDNINAVFDDDAPAFVCSTNAPSISGTVKPLGSLEAFKGESTFGEWILSVIDNSSADGGVFKSFGLEICAQGEFRPDDDKDGVFDDGPDLCLNTPLGTTVNTSGCPVASYSANNFRIQAQSETCRSSNDGSIKIEVTDDLDYSINTTVNGQTTTDSFTAPMYSIDNLTAGTYNFCISATKEMQTFEAQCFQVVVSEPELLSVASQSSLDGRTVDLQLQGASLYNITLNGVLTQTRASSYKLNLNSGKNTLKVSSNLPCQGVYEEQFFFATEPFLYPNPTTESVIAYFGVPLDRVAISIFSSNGSLLFEENYQVDGTELELDLSRLSAGLYFVKYQGEAVSGTFKIAKK